MPPKRKKYSTRFPPARIKKIMQTDDEVGKVAAGVPVVISKALEIFLHTLLSKASQLADERSARTLTAQHLKWCIESDSQYDFLVDLAKAVPDVKRGGGNSELEDVKPERKRKQPSKKKAADDRKDEAEPVGTHPKTTIVGVGKGKASASAGDLATGSLGQGSSTGMKSVHSSVSVPAFSAISSLGMNVTDPTKGKVETEEDDDYDA
eukprot:m.309141 g.309141  ORF g.309141 m.309141 type:complete len:207 (+) comp45595_c0_seq1:27-647(+)